MFTLLLNEPPFIEFLVELWLLLFEAKLRDEVLGCSLPSLEELERNALRAMGDLESHGSVFLIFRPIHLMHRAQYDNIYGRFDQAKAGLLKAKEMLTTMEMPAYRRRCEHSLNELEQHMVLQRNLFNISKLSLEVCR